MRHVFIEYNWDEKSTRLRLSMNFVPNGNFQIIIKLIKEKLS